MATAPNQSSLYNQIGGKSALRTLVESFYDIIESDPDGARVHVLHLRGHGMNHTRIAQFEFLSGFFGGPKLYVERTGHSDMRLVHEHVPVAQAEVDAWLLCMRKNLDNLEYETDLKERLMMTFTRAAIMIKNRD
jgi:hemoglobin